MERWKTKKAGVEEVEGDEEEERKKTRRRRRRKGVAAENVVSRSLSVTKKRRARFLPARLFLDPFLCPSSSSGLSASHGRRGRGKSRERQEKTGGPEDEWSDACRGVPQALLLERVRAARRRMGARACLRTVRCSRSVTKQVGVRENSSAAFSFACEGEEAGREGREGREGKLDDRVQGNQVECGESAREKEEKKTKTPRPLPLPISAAASLSSRLAYLCVVRLHNLSPWVLSLSLSSYHMRISREERRIKKSYESLLFSLLLLSFSRSLLPTPPTPLPRRFY